MPMNDEERARNHAREALIARLEEIAATNAESAQTMAEAAANLSGQIEELTERMTDILDHMEGWENFLNQFLSTYHPEEEARARQDFLSFCQNFFQAAQKIRKRS